MNIKQILLFSLSFCMIAIMANKEEKTLEKIFIEANAIIEADQQESVDPSTCLSTKIIPEEIRPEEIRFERKSDEIFIVTQLFKNKSIKPFRGQRFQFFLEKLGIDSQEIEKKLALDPYLLSYYVSNYQIGKYYSDGTCVLVQTFSKNTLPWEQRCNIFSEQADLIRYNYKNLNRK